LLLAVAYIIIFLEFQKENEIKEKIKIPNCSFVKEKVPHISMFTKSRPKYVQHVRALYPNASQPQRKLQNLSALIHFAQTNPKYLKEIGAYLNHRIRKHVQKAEIG
jgi:hypothetical protein